ncbi:DUF761 domain-containing protein [Quillaja saponaria]|uniref:DUF761 domain-containing protein n=1 Tax=Quillaja saponaria TaxID=32244 RepID=A0AAD7PP97_QUISA|nr:DUF761 domain-containing protein [Quillaja saponaria]
MRRSTIPSSPAYQQAQPIHRKQEGVPNFREQMIKMSSTAAPSHGDGTDQNTKKKKKEIPAMAKKLESKPSGQEDINESAEAFIQNFRKQLMIQRLESIENYEKMLQRGL